MKREKQNATEQSLPLDFGVDLSEDKLLKLYPTAFRTLLLDQTKSREGTRRNIFWATHDYEARGDGYGYNDPILPALITGRNSTVIVPRVKKDKATQRERSKGKAEVFTPSWICNAQNNLIDEAWFGRKDVFNREYYDHECNKHKWKVWDKEIAFSKHKGKRSYDYIKDTRLEITCGEAPYLVSRYDTTTTGKAIALAERIGILDRKLRVVAQIARDAKNKEKTWRTWAQIAMQSVYGFEWQGDSLLLARENLFATYIEYFRAEFDGRLPTAKTMNTIAKIISWNLWQMDGLKGVVPDSCDETRFCEGCMTGNIHKHNGIYCHIMNWCSKEPILFADLLPKDMTTSRRYGTTKH